MQLLKSLLKSSWTVKLSLALASALIGLITAELAFRLIKRESVKLHGMYGADAELGVSLKPGFRGSMQTSEFSYDIAINDLGMRDEPVTPKAPNSRRVLVIGDSFVFGVGVEPREGACVDHLRRRRGRALFERLFRLVGDHALGGGFVSCLVGVGQGAREEHERG